MPAEPSKDSVTRTLSRFSLIEVAYAYVQSRSFLKVRAYRNVGDSAVSAAGVLLVDGAQLRRRVGLLGEHRTRHGLNVLLTVLSVLEQGRAPGVPSDRSPSDEDCCCGLPNSSSS